MTVVTVKVAAVEFAATVTLAGTVADVELLPNVTTAPPAGAGPFSVTVPFEFARPPCTLIGLTTTERTDGGMTVSAADCAAVAPTFAEMDTPVDTPTASGVTVNVVDVVFAGTVTPDGTVATLGVLLVNVTTVPPEAAGTFNVTVPVEV